ncbi:MAG: N-acetylmuramoyl-L-alanine amidase [Sphingobacteriaceae bacterium]|nr:N-acetylmuramoyl-L-alanine amidase [Sphingobacteriaceae bacterium]
MFKEKVFILLTAAFFFACSSKKFAQTDRIYKKNAASFAGIIKQVAPENQKIDSLPSTTPQYWVGTVNMGMRKPNFVVLHHTAQDSTAQTLKTFTITKTGVSAHYVVGRNGEIVQMVNDYLRAYHAGAGKWGNVTDLNSCSIGIEIDNNGVEPYSEIQIQSVLKLCKTLKKRYNIPVANFIAHADIAPKRKSDPANFPWQRLAQNGIGFWYDDVMETPPSNFDALSALRIIGYDVSDAKAAVVAFKRHFIQTDLSATLSENDIKILFNLYKKYL